MCEKAIEDDPDTPEFVPDHLNTQKMSKEAVEKYLYNLIFVSDRFVTQEQVKLWHDDASYCNNDKPIGWYDGHQKRKAEKAKIKEELMPITWHPSRWWVWCVPEDEKKRQKNCGHKHKPFCIL